MSGLGHKWVGCLIIHLSIYDPFIYKLIIHLSIYDPFIYKLIIHYPPNPFN